MTSPTTIPAPATPYATLSLPNRGRAHYALGVLLLAYVFSIMDRQVLSLLVGPIQQSLHVNDAWMGMLHGFTFAAFYSLAGLPIARLIDRGNRRLIIIVGIGLWCLATAASGLASEFWHLLLARVGVAVGEAVLLPGAVSLISDLFVVEKRGRALGVFGAGGPVGVGGGLLATGLVLGYFSTYPLTLPWLGTLAPWQTTLMSIGLPGLIVLFLMLGVPEPRRDRVPRTTATAIAANVPLKEVLAFLRANRRTFLAIVVGMGCYNAAVYGGGAWVPSYLVREFGWTYAKAGTVMGLIMCVSSPLGVLGASWLGEYWRRRGVANGNLRVAICASLLLPLCATPLLLAPTATMAMPFLALSAGLWVCLFGIGPALIVDIAPAPMRGQFIALYTGILNLLGVGIGPLAIGVITDYVLVDPAAIRYSILIVTLIACALACPLLFCARHSFKTTVRHAGEWRPATHNI
ncbi:MFS transporter [Pseudomonas vancouverensis]|uniref:MFS transporter n=1 Tax=Pseudomonas vancouverensis TaxID=95300 RepID=A0A1H2NLZ3_PSEVA|nr:MFS transporter [Pseudomonas vancouverensis]KAB0495278.1 MFS transporter [Pseudomonas vancouverensis]TDB56961.1 MFS transporter [Pseudomonas vancouverensis]SDV06489.1 Predicted arabinose efflux permease, MFS family [Pseudomonas vancouverensis]